MDIKRIQTPNAPKSAGHYSHAVVYNGLVFVSGQLSIDPATGQHKLGSIEEQTEQALSNVHAILKAAGSDWDRVLKVNISVADINLWDAVNKVYARVLGENRPRARRDSHRSIAPRFSDRDRSNRRHRSAVIKNTLVKPRAFHLL